MGKRLDTEYARRLLGLYGVPRPADNPETSDVVPDTLYSGGEIAARKMTSRLLSLLPEKLFLALTAAVKALRQGRGHYSAPEEHALERLVRRARIPGKGLWGSGPLPLVLTHDVDLKACSRHAAGVMRLENGLGVTSTWHFLTGGRYPLMSSQLDDLAANGHEIGLHGVWHDLAFGYRSEAYQARMISKGLAALRPYDPVSYRAPGLAWTRQLAASLAACGVRADSSLRTYNGGWSLLRPVPLFDGKLWELPLTLQDDLLFKNLRLSGEEASAMISEALREAGERRAPVVLNFHPSIIGERPAWYGKVLEGVLRNGVWRIRRVRDILAELDAAWKRSGNE